MYASAPSCTEQQDVQNELSRGVRPTLDPALKTIGLETDGIQHIDRMPD